MDQTKLDSETSKHKLVYLVVAIVWACAFLAMGWSLAAAKKNSHDIDKVCSKGAKNYYDCDAIDDNFFDNMFYNGPWSDSSEASELLLKIATSGRDEDDFKKGTRFTVCFGFGAVTLLALAAANVCLAIGAYVLVARKAGLILAGCFGCLNFISIIVIGCYRFNLIGQLAALSETPAKFSHIDELLYVTNDMLYNDYVTRLTAVWVFQMVLCCCTCATSGYLNKPAGGMTQG